MPSTSTLAAQGIGLVASGALERGFTFFERGGPFMWPLLVCSILALTVVFERLFALWRFHSANYYFRACHEEIFKLVASGEFERALERARETDSPVCRIFAQALDNREIGFGESLQMAAQKELDRLRRGLSLLDTAITVAPMFGILGTVTGTMQTFNVLGGSGMDNPLGATAGIAEALITTVSGLAVAIACLFPFNFFVSQIKRHTMGLEQTIHRFELAYKMGVGRHAEPLKDGQG